MENSNVAVVLFNLGGPDSLENVKPFLFNLFFDKYIIRLPTPIRWLIAKLISSRREAEAQEIYAHIGNKSPLLDYTKKQAEALEKFLNTLDTKKNYKVFIAMRYFNPRAEHVINEVKKYAPTKIVYLPLYPQYSSTTSLSSIEEFKKLSKKKNLDAVHNTICCYPNDEKFIDAHLEEFQKLYDKIDEKTNIKVIFSAHGLPESIIKAGDPYQFQVELTVENFLKKLPYKLDYIISYQSRVGPVKWIGPYTDEIIEHHSKENKIIFIVPIAFVSEHSETLYELDIQYKNLASSNGAKAFYRVPSLNCNSNFIKALADMVINVDEEFHQKRICDQKFCLCLNNRG